MTDGGQKWKTSHVAGRSTNSEALPLSDTSSSFTQTVGYSCLARIPDGTRGAQRRGTNPIDTLSQITRIVVSYLRCGPPQNCIWTMHYAYYDFCSILIVMGANDNPGYIMQLLSDPDICARNDRIIPRTKNSVKQ